MVVDLFARQYESVSDSGRHCIVLHGLLGSSRNWATAAKELARFGHVHVLDLRNHGQSPHTASMRYLEMADDVLAWMNGQQISQACVIGHSLGGKVAMRLACSYPERVESLAVLDIAPKAYPPRWEREFDAMRSLDLATLPSRSAAEEALTPHVRDWAFRKFLCTNLERTPEGALRWIVNLQLLQDCLPDLFKAVLSEDDHYNGPAVFLRGEKSTFVLDEDRDLINQHFPRAELLTVQNAGHNIHFDQLPGMLNGLEAIWTH